MSTYFIVDLNHHLVVALLPVKKLNKSFFYMQQKRMKIWPRSIDVELIGLASDTTTSTLFLRTSKVFMRFNFIF